MPKKIQAKIPPCRSANTEVTLTWSEIRNLLADREELINIYENMPIKMFPLADGEKL